MKINLKKNVLSDIEKLKKENRTLNKEEQQKIRQSLIANWAIGISLVILIMTFKISANLVSQIVTVKLYNICSIVLLIYSIIIFEIAYKQDSSKWAISGIEMLVISVVSLFSPYIFYKFSINWVYVIIGLITVYYTAKIIMIYFFRKREIALKNSDITEIIKKESKDEKAEEFKINMKSRIEKSKGKKKKTDNVKTKKETTKNKKVKKTETKKKTAKKETNPKTATQKENHKKEISKQEVKKTTKSDAKRTTRKSKAKKEQNKKETK